MELPDLHNLLKIDFKKNQKQVLIFLALVSLLAVFIYFNYLLRPQVMRVVDVIVKMNRLDTDLKGAKADISKIPDYKNDISKYKEQVDSYERMLPAEQEIPTLLENLSNMAKSSGVKIESIMPVARKEDKNKTSQVYQEIPILITAKSGYHELGNFIAKLEGAERFMKIVDIDMRSVKVTPKRHDVELLVLTYILVGGG